jgi:hypothetical protein
MCCRCAPCHAVSEAGYLQSAKYITSSPKHNDNDSVDASSVSQACATRIEDSDDGSSQGALNILMML